MPPIAAAVLAAGLRYPVVRAFNIAVVAFGLTAPARPAAHVRRYGSRALDGHVAAGVLLNAAIAVLVAACFFTGLDPIRIRR